MTMALKDEQLLFVAFARALTGERVNYVAANFERAQFARQLVRKWASNLPVMCHNGIPTTLRIDYGQRLRGTKADRVIVDDNLIGDGARASATYILNTMLVE